MAPRQAPVNDASIDNSQEIACDESGWEGANLVAGNSAVIAYASVRLSAGEASAWLGRLGGRPEHTGREFKAAHVLRSARSAVTGLLTSAGPIHGNALVHLTDKAYFVVGRLLDLILGESTEAASAGLTPDPRLTGWAATLIHEGPQAFGPLRWQGFLGLANAVLRDWKPRRVREPVDDFIDMVESLSGSGGKLDPILDEISRARPAAYAARERLLEHHVIQPAVEPLISALARTVLHWSRDGGDVSIVHDEQSAMTERRLRRLERQLLPPGRALRLRQVDSRTDPRVQVADVLAGVARRIATDELHGHGDPELTGLLRPFVDPASCWRFSGKIGRGE